MARQIVECFGRPPANLAPSIFVRRWDHALIVGLVAAGVVYALASLVAWPDPLAGALDGLRLLAWLLTLGTGDPPEILRAVRYEPGTGWRLAVTLLPAWLAGAAGAWLGARPYCHLRHIAGPRLLDGAEASRAAHKAAAAEGAPFMRLGSMALTKSRWTRHLLIFGGVGSGKTQILLPIVGQIIDARHRAIIYDAKGDFTAYFPAAALLSPWDERSRFWDISRDIRTAAQAATFAAAIIPIEDGGGRYWSTAAQQLLLGTVRGLAAELGPGRWGWRTLADRLAQSQTDFLARLREDYARALPLISDASQGAGGVLATLAAYTRPIDDLATAWGNGEGRRPWSAAAWAADGFQGRPAVILQGGPDHALTRAYVGAIVDLLVPEVLSLPDDEHGRSLFFVLDELPSLGRLNIQPLIDRGRSKGVCVIAGLQDLAQLRSTYGEHQAQALQAMIGTTVVCRLAQGQTRDQVAESFGRARVAILSPAGGPTHEETRAAVPSSELSAIGPFRTRKHAAGFAIRAIVGGLGDDALRLDFPGVRLPIKRRPRVPAPWTRPGALERDRKAQHQQASPPPAGGAGAAPAGAGEGPAGASQNGERVAKIRENLAAGASCFNARHEQ